MLFMLSCRRDLFNLDEHKQCLYDREGHFDGRVAVKVAHVVGDLEDVHDETEEAKQQQTSCNRRRQRPLYFSAAVPG